MLSTIKASNWFLTAKGKLIDNEEWHSFGAGLILASMMFITFELMGSRLWLYVDSVFIVTVLLLDKLPHKSFKQYQKEFHYILCGHAPPMVFYLVAKVYGNAIMQQVVHLCL